MDFGYFTLSDNHYENNTRAANQFVTDIAEEALHADKLGMHSAWIGEHHFNSLGVLSCPDLVLAHAAARTQRIRLAPAVTVNAVVPSQIASPRTDAMPDYKSAAIAGTPLGRLVTAPEIARMVVLVCSPDFDFVTGRAVVMDGGRAIPTFPRIGVSE